MQLIVRYTHVVRPGSGGEKRDRHTLRKVRLCRGLGMRILVWLGIALTETAVATIIVTPQQRLIERASIAAIQGEHRQASLDLMEAIAEGKPKEIVLTASDKAGLKSYIQD